jgi:hypothetical protein
MVSNHIKLYRIEHAKNQGESAQSVANEIARLTLINYAATYTPSRHKFDVYLDLIATLRTP